MSFASPFWRLMLLARAAWAGVAIVTIGLFILGIPALQHDWERRSQALVALDAHQNSAGEIILSPWWDVLGPASHAGVLQGDILVAIDGMPVSSRAGPDAVEALSRGAIGEQLRLSVRTGDRSVREVVLIRGGEDARMLAPLGLSFASVVAFTVGVDIALALVFVLVAVVIFWHRSTDWRVILVSASCLWFLTTAAAVLALDARPEWRSLLNVVWSLAFASTCTFFY